MRRKCDMPFKIVKIQMDGQIFMCSAGQPANLNAFDVAPDSIWNSARFIELRRQLDEETYDTMCRSCPLVQDFADDRPERESLHALAMAFRLTGEDVVDGDGKPVPVSKTMAGMVDIIDRVNGRIVLTGWACDVAEAKPAAAIVVFFNDTAIAAVAPTLERADVARHFGKQQLTVSGFSIDIPQPLSGEKVRVFAIDVNGKIGMISCPDIVP
jgi:radical SAM protein with 4Fe4S-binding SPASM domain